MPRIYNNVLPNGPVPAWRIVVFPTNQQFVYDDLEHADNARIIARAWFNLEEKKGHKLRWADFARYLNYLRPRKPNKSNPGLSYAISDKLYGNVLRGTLPKNERVRHLLLELSGWPWE